MNKAELYKDNTTFNRKMADLYREKLIATLYRGNPENPSYDAMDPLYRDEQVPL